MPKSRAPRWSIFAAPVWSVPTAAIIVAENITKASVLLREKLESIKLNADYFTLQEIELDTEKAEILNDGDY